MMMDQTSDFIEGPQHDGSEHGAPNQPDAEMVTKTKLSDINIDCQERVFKHLDLLDLLNIADSSKQFKTAADLVFAKKFGNERVNVVYIQPYRKQCGKVDETVEWIHSAKTCLQVFRNFGHLITVLEFGPANVLEKTHLKESFSLLYKFAIEYINEYCAESLTEFLIHQCPKGFLKYLKPLPNVSTVEIESFGFEGQSKDSLKTLFPKLNRLIYIDFNQSLGIIENHFPHLEHFCVRRGSGHGIVPWDNISPAVLDSNPQLRTLFCFDIGPGVNVLRSMERLQHLEELQLIWDMKFVTPRNEFNGEIFRFRTVKILGILFMNPERTPSCKLPKIPFSFDQLKKCTIDVKKCCPAELYNFFDHNPTIVELYLCIVWNTLNLSAIAKALPSLRIFKLTSHAKLTKKDIIDFVNSLKFLKNANFVIRDHDSSKELMESFDNGWQASIEMVGKWTILTLERSD
ncbi:uncharacterized protein LOC129576421 [Sitodiplosis mosellana]|uniref:uncharacterized protein LOC129576421 n=1 Tax=Sitodiplosis mosellana TaxID=263140 RepID=UPI0024452E36|nr:uncharacterized protein LOC129576421 [Sitodiplosis mosellana]